MGWEKIRKSAKPKRKTGIGGVPSTTLESENLLLEIFSNRSLPDGDKVRYIQLSNQNIMLETTAKI